VLPAVSAALPGNVAIDNSTTVAATGRHLLQTCRAAFINGVSRGSRALRLLLVTDSSLGKQPSPRAALLPYPRLIQRARPRRLGVHAKTTSESLTRVPCVLGRGPQFGNPSDTSSYDCKPNGCTVSGFTDQWYCNRDYIPPGNRVCGTLCNVGGCFPEDSTVQASRSFLMRVCLFAS
jgi:hypothetical protein